MMKVVNGICHKLSKYNEKAGSAEGDAAIFACESRWKSAKAKKMPKGVQLAGKRLVWAPGRSTRRG